MKVIIKYQGFFVENFTKKSISVTDNINRAGKYSIKTANKHIENKKIIAELIPAN